MTLETDLETARVALNRFIANTYESMGSDHPVRVHAAKVRDEIGSHLKAVRACQCLAGMRWDSCLIHGNKVA